MTFPDPLNEFKFSAGYFGKLPGFADFLKYNAASPEILILDRWIQDGMVWGRKTGKNYFLNKQANRQNSFEDFSPVYFFFPFTGTENILLGIISPSCDKSGREFPFIIFLSINKNKFAELPAHLFPLFFRGWFELCGTFFNEISSPVSAGKESLINLNAKLNNTFPFRARKNLFDEAKNSYNNFILESKQIEFGQKVLDDRGGVKFSAFLNNLLSGLSFLRRKPDSSVSFGIKMSMIENPDFSFYNVAFFIHTIMIISGRDSNPGVFIKNAKSFTRLFVFFSSPLPQHLVDLFYDNGDGERMFDANAFRNSEKINSGINSFAGNPESKLKDILDELTLINSYSDEGNRRKFNI